MSDGARPTTGAKRFLKLAGMTASVAGSYAKAQLKALFQSAEKAFEERRQAHVESGRRIAATLGELKGAAMKVGQMASVATAVLPTELIEALRLLQRSAPPMPYEVIAQQIEAQLGASPDELFRWLDPAPFAAASIGQVHLAELEDGRAVICKVQYPGVEEAVDSDLRHLKLALRASGLAKLHGHPLDEPFEELRVRLHEELDYCREADNLRLLRGFHATRHPFVRIPEVIGERSAQKVLTLTFEAGDVLSDLDALGYTQDERDRLGRHLALFILDEVFEANTFHADPHPGNFAFRHDGTLVVYDFGCIKHLPANIVTGSRELLIAAIDDDLAGVDHALTTLDARRLSGPPVDPEFYRAWCDFYRSTFVAPPLVDFSKPTGLREHIQKNLSWALKQAGAFKPAPHLMMLNRMLIGHHGNLRALRARVPLGEMLRARLRHQVA